MAKFGFDQIFKAVFKLKKTFIRFRLKIWLLFVYVKEKIRKTEE